VPAPGAPTPAAPPSAAPALADDAAPAPARAADGTAVHAERCDAGDAAACSRLGAAYLWGRGVAQDGAAGERLLRRGCDGGDLRGCYLLGLGEEGAAATALLTVACDGGVALACRALALDHDDAEDRPAANARYERACELGDALGCYQLGDRARGRARVAWYRRSCERDWLEYDLMLDEAPPAEPLADHRGCLRLAQIYLRDEDPGATPAQSIRALEALCERGVPAGCDFAAQRHGPALAAVLPWWRKGCDAGGVAQCYALGRRLVFEGERPEDRALAIDLLARACDGGDDGACDLLARIRR
jgi:uncharacterized protein